jgi:hypothetical protein
MPDPQVLARLAVQLTETTDPDTRDRLLDLWLHFDRLATDVDARAWGFRRRWCIRERRELMRRAHFSMGVVQLDDTLGTTEGTTR